MLRQGVLRHARSASVLAVLTSLSGCPSTEPQPIDLLPVVPGTVCEPNDQRCSANSVRTIQICRADGRGWFEKSCPTGSVCDPLTASCTSESSGCYPGEAKCTGSPGTASRSVCSADGSGWSNDSCQGNLVCEPTTGACLEPVCTHGESRCDGGPADPDRSTCAPDRLSFMSTPCSNSAVCVPTNDSSKCVSRLCSPGETLCSSDFTKILRCDASGTILETSASCSVNEACQAGSCKASDHPLGNVLRTHGIDNATLSPGRYAIAVVHTDPSDDDLVPFPLEMSGPVADPPGTLALHPRTKDRTILSGTSAMLLQRPQLRAMPIDIGPLPDSPTPQDDSVRLFHVPDHASGGAITLTRTARLRASGQHVNLWEDQTTSAPGTQIPDSALPDLLHRIDQAVIPRAVVMMGQPTDVDGNGKIDILFTDVLPDAVAAFSHPSATLFAPGSFSTSYDYGEVVYSHGMSPGQPTWEVATLMSHEIAQLIYLGARLSPYLEDDPASVPAWVHADIYAVEGLASIAMGWSGQSWAWPAVKALEHPEEMSLWRLTASSYLTDPMTNLASYGFGTLVQEYLFDQAGALKVKGSVFEDAGGLAYIDAFTNHQSGWERIGPLDGRPLSEWYVDFAVALLVHGLQEKVSTETALDTRFVFAETIEDTVWGGFIGPTLRYDHMLDTTETGPILSPVAWSHRPSKLRRGGVCFLAFDVGEAGAMLTLTDALTTVAVMRYVP